MIWFDLDNSPHVPLFRPILGKLSEKNVDCYVTAREFAQTRDLLEYWKIPYKLIGAHGGKHKVKKVLNLLHRTAQLATEVRRKNISLAVSHGSRTQVVAASLLGIPSVVMLDYEYTESRIFNQFADHLYMPAIIPDQRLKAAGFKLKKIIRYHGLKEEIYLHDFVPEPDFRTKHGLGEGKILITMRPPSVLGNYHDSRSEKLYIACLHEFSQFPGVHILIVNRTSEEAKIVPGYLRERSNITFLKAAIDGLQLIWNSDIFISGGGTMNREAALLGVPTYSIFSGRKPYVDEFLEESGKMTYLAEMKDLETIALKRRENSSTIQQQGNTLVEEIAGTLLTLAGS